MAVGSIGVHAGGFTPRADFEKFKADIQEEVVLRDRMGAQATNKAFHRIGALEEKPAQPPKFKTPTWVKVSVPLTAAVAVTGIGLGIYAIWNIPSHRTSYNA